MHTNLRVSLVPLLLLITGLGCNDLSGLTGKQQLPSGIPDPGTLRTRAGALAMYQGVLAAFQAGTATSAVSSGTSNSGTFVNFMLTSGLLTDELASGDLGGNRTSYDNSDEGLLIDTRHLAEGVDNSQTDGLYTNLQQIRNSAHLAIASLAAYDTSDSPALRGHLYALTGYSELFLADLYCSGVPLSTLDFTGDFTYHAGSTTDQLYQAAIAQFDTAIALSADSVMYVNLARVGQARAYLARGKYDSAAAIVHNVPTDFSYQFSVDWGGGFPGGLFSTAGIRSGVTVANVQGGTGLPYLSNLDPRTASETWGHNLFGVPQYAPVAYGGAALASPTATFIAPITVANGIEARLIEAEAALHTGTGQWLTTLNTLRAMVPPITITVPIDTLIDTLGVTGCPRGAAGFPVCRTSPGGDSIGFGQPAQGFPGYTLVGGDTTYPAPVTIQARCRDNSYFRPCAAGDSMVVLTYVKPASTRQLTLSSLQDPGASPGDTARIRLLFTERAYWLFLTGHRQGDLRRLIRNYHLSPSAVYPSGSNRFFFDVYSQFGTDVNAPVPRAEQADPMFHSCFSRGA